ncbi:MAG: hypothetical protein ACLGI5_20795 [Thermoleophilia bacterium]
MSANRFPEDEPLPDHMSLLLPHQRAAVAARRAAPPASAFEALLRASAPVEGDPPVPLDGDAPPAAGMPLTQAQPGEPMAEGLSLLTPEQRAEMRERRGAGSAR